MGDDEHGGDMEQATSAGPVGARRRRPPALPEWLGGGTSIYATIRSFAALHRRRTIQASEKGSSADAGATLPNWSGSVPLPATPGVPSWTHSRRSTKAVTVPGEVLDEAGGSALPLVQGELPSFLRRRRARPTRRHGPRLARGYLGAITRRRARRSTLDDELFDGSAFVAISETGEIQTSGRIRI